jgi:hypothetical protein
MERVACEQLEKLEGANQKVEWRTMKIDGDVDGKGGLVDPWPPKYANYRQVESQLEKKDHQIVEKIVVSKYL